MARKILLLITDLEIGGTPTVVRELATRLNDPPQTQIEVACLAPWGPVADELHARNLPVHALAAQSPRDLAVILRLISLIRREHYDTVLSFLIHANAIAAIASRALSFRLIQSIQTTQPRPRWHWWIQSLLHGRARTIVVPSRSAADFARDRAHVPIEKIAVIPNAIDPDDFAPSAVPMSDEKPFPIGFIGRLDPIKRVPHLLRSLTHARQPIHLHIFGEGRDRTEILAEIHRLGLEQRVTVHGPVSRPQEALTRIGALVLPSQAEGFGLVLIEAMAARVPIIATNVPGIRDVVTNEDTGLLVHPDDERQLARAIDRIITDRPLRQLLIDRAQRHVRETYTWTQVLPQYRALLHLS